MFCMLFLGKVTVYLGKRDFIDHLDSVDPIDGVVVVDSDYLKGRRIYGQVGPYNCNTNIRFTTIISDKVFY